MKVGIVSDIHEDMNSLNRSLNILKGNKCDMFACLGDIIGFTIPTCQGYLKTRDARESALTIKKNFDVAIVGNHDLNAVDRIPKFTADYKYPRNWYRLDHFSRYEMFRDKIWHYTEDLPPLLDMETRRYIIGLPEIAFKYFDDLCVMFSHYAYPDVPGFTTHRHKLPKYLHKHFRYMKVHNASYCFSGHEHVEGLKVFTEDDVKEYGFDEEVKLDPEKKQWILCPAVFERQDQQNGVAILDIKKQTVIAKRLNS